MTGILYAIGNKKFFHELPTEDQDRLPIYPKFVGGIKFPVEMKYASGTPRESVTRHVDVYSIDDERGMFVFGPDKAQSSIFDIAPTLQEPRDNVGFLIVKALFGSAASASAAQ